jgi:hypothetical protein
MYKIYSFTSIHTIIDTRRWGGDRPGGLASRAEAVWSPNIYIHIHIYIYIYIHILNDIFVYMVFIYVYITTYTCSSLNAFINIDEIIRSTKI